MDVFLIYEGINFPPLLKPIALGNYPFLVKILDTKNDHLRRLDDDKLYCASFTPLLESTY